MHTAVSVSLANYLIGGRGRAKHMTTGTVRHLASGVMWAGKTILHKMHLSPACTSDAIFKLAQAGKGIYKRQEMVEQNWHLSGFETPGQAPTWPEGAAWGT